MAETINKLIYNLRLQLKDNKVDDLKFSDRNLEYMIQYIRAKLIRQDIQRHKKISNSYKQSLGVVELELVDYSEDPEFETGLNVLRTSREIPTSIDVDGKQLITSITGLDKGNRIDILSRAQAIKRSNMKYASKRLCAYLDDDNRIYFPNCNTELRYVNISGVFENPRAVSSFSKKSGESCYDPDVERYPMPLNMVDQMNSIIKRNELDLYFQLIEDKINDAQANI